MDFRYTILNSKDYVASPSPSRDIYVVPLIACFIISLQFSTPEITGGVERLVGHTFDLLNAMRIEKGFPSIDYPLSEVKNIDLFSLIDYEICTSKT